jgi:hypothetical protein
VVLLRKLLKFTDKGELFKVLLKRPLRDRQSKKAVRLSIIPTDVEENEGFEIKKKQYFWVDLGSTATRFRSCSASTRRARNACATDHCSLHASTFLSIKSLLSTHLQLILNSYFLFQAFICSHFSLFCPSSF